jgi:hypothetical protein
MLRERRAVRGVQVPRRVNRTFVILLARSGVLIDDALLGFLASALFCLLLPKISLAKASFFFL